MKPARPLFFRIPRNRKPQLSLAQSGQPSILGGSIARFCRTFALGAAAAFGLGHAGAATLIWDADAAGGNGAQDGAGNWTPGTTVSFYNGTTDVIGATIDIYQFGNGGTLG